MNNFSDNYFLEKKLPKPNSVYVGDNVDFFIYKAKNWFEKKWVEPELKRLVFESRKSYQRHGNREMFDKYDTKAVIYLACAWYPTHALSDKATKEWLSVRFVPGHGKPLGANELEIFYLNNDSLDNVVKEKVFRGDHNFWRYIVASSRMCGMKLYGNDVAVKLVSSKHKYTASCFSLIQKQFLDDYKKDGLTFKYLTEVVINDFMKKALMIKSGKEIIVPPSVPAYRFLSKNPKEIRPDRNIYSYRFPTYWFNVSQLKRFLNKMTRERLLSVRILKTYENKLGVLFTHKGKIHGSKLTGEELRLLIDKFVEDGPELKITDLKTWRKGINFMIQVARLKKI